MKAEPQSFSQLLLIEITFQYIYLNLELLFFLFKT